MSHHHWHGGWRWLLVAGETTLGDLHRAIQAAMGWEDHHLHTFDIEGRQYGDPRAVDDVADEKRVTLNGLIKSGVVRFAYTYDFGENWEHALVIEKSLPGLEAPSRPICSAGKRRCPPEDCGGPWGYLELLDVLADPAHPEDVERSEWLGEDLDLDDFNPEIADATLVARFGRTRPPHVRDAPLVN